MSSQWRVRRDFLKGFWKVQIVEHIRARVTTGFVLGILLCLLSCRSTSDKKRLLTVSQIKKLLADPQAPGPSVFAA